METYYYYKCCTSAENTDVHFNNLFFFTDFFKKQFKINVQNKSLNISVHVISFFSASLISDMPFCLMRDF